MQFHNHPPRSILIASAAAACAALAIAGHARAADFYAGKDISLVIGSAPGGGYDTYARLLARYLPHHIPGQPNIIPRNLPGAGSGKAAVFIYSVAPKDGTAIAAIFPGAIVGPLLDDRVKVDYVPTKFNYLTSADSGTRVCATLKPSKIKTLKDAMTTETTLGASQAGGSTRDYAIMLNNMTGTKFKVISGYAGSAPIMLAIERHEVDGLCGLDWTSFKTQKPDWIRDNKINILVQVGPDPEPELTAKGVPEVWSFIKDADNRQAAELIVAQQVFGRPYIAPPGTPKDRVAALRQAFAATLSDPKLLKDATKSRLSIHPSSGERVQSLVAKLYATPKAIVQKAKDAMGIEPKKPKKKQQG